jgi:hypothetical protein
MPDIHRETRLTVTLPDMHRVTHLTVTMPDIHRIDRQVKQEIQGEF